MKKTILAVFLAIVAMQSYSQTGDLYVGAKGGYISSYKGVVYGAEASYQVSDPIEVSLSFLMNTGITLTEEVLTRTQDTKVQLYSANLDLRYYVLRQRTWAMGPALGFQFASINEKQQFGDNVEYKTTPLGLNIGWHMRYDITENIKLNGGWRYAAMNEKASNHLFYLGLGYSFSLY